MESLGNGHEGLKSSNDTFTSFKSFRKLAEIFGPHRTTKIPSNENFTMWDNLIFQLNAVHQRHKPDAIVSFALQNSNRRNLSLCCKTNPFAPSRLQKWMKINLYSGRYSMTAFRIVVGIFILSSFDVFAYRRKNKASLALPHGSGSFDNMES